MNNREVVAAVADAFNDNNADIITSHMTEDVEWHMLGDSVLSGKQTIVDFFKNHPDIKAITCTQDHFVVEGDVASVSGEVTCSGPNGIVMDMYYCDIYELTGGKISKMITYGVMKK